MDFDDSQAAAQLAALARTTPDALVTIDVESRIRFVNPAIEDVLGYAPAEVRGESLAVLMSDELAERHFAGIERYLSTGERRLDWDGVELPGRHADGHDVPLSIAFSEFTLGGERYFTGILRDVTERRRRLDRLERLSRLGGELLDAESDEAAVELAVAAADELLEAPFVTLARYDAETGRLVPAASTPAVHERLTAPPLFGEERGPPWQAFANDETLRFEDGEDDPALAAAGLESALVVPVAEHGVLVAAGERAGGVSETDRRLAGILAGTLAAIFARLDREAALRRRTSELAAKNERLERVQRVNEQIRDITQLLMDATSREEIKQVVCDRLAGSDPYRFVWFGERDLGTDEIVPVAWAGVEEGYLDAIEVTADRSETGRGPAGRAVRTGERQIENDFQTDPPFEPWRREALQRGYRSGISVPVDYRDTRYGVLNLYASAADVFSEIEAAVLTELGEMIGYGLNAMERYDALVAEDSVELEFAVRDEENPLLTLLGDHDGRFRLESIGASEGTGQRVFVAFEGVPIEALRTFVDRHLGEGEMTTIRDRDGEVVVEVTLPRESLVGTLLERGAVPTEIRGTRAAANVTIRIAKSAGVREFLELFEERYADAELLARRESADPVQTAEQFERAYVDRLTDRQREVLRTAYFAGFFEQPRANSARDVARMLDVSQPTVSRHIRAGEQRLFSMLFDDDPGT